MSLNNITVNNTSVIKIKSDATYFEDNLVNSQGISVASLYSSVTEKLYTEIKEHYFVLENGELREITISGGPFYHAVIISNFYHYQTIEYTGYWNGSGCPLAVLFDKDDNVVNTIWANPDDHREPFNDYYTIYINPVSYSDTYEKIIFNNYVTSITYDFSNILPNYTTVENYPAYISDYAKRLIYFKTAPFELSLYCPKLCYDANYNKFLSNQYTDDYDVYIITGPFDKINNLQVTLNVAGNVFPVIIFNEGRKIIKGIPRSDGELGIDTITINVDFTNIENASYVLLNAYGYGSSETPSILYSTSPQVQLQERYPEYTTQLKNEIVSMIEHYPSQKISMFFFGNSLTISAVLNLPILLKHIAPDLDFKICFWYNAGATLKMQYEQRLTQHRPCEIFAVADNTISWTRYDNMYTIEDIFNQHSFDIISFQEYSYYEFTEQQFSTNFANVYNYIKNIYNKPFKSVYLVDEPNRSKVESMYSLALQYATWAIKNTLIEDVLMPGSAMYYGLKNNLLQPLGDMGNMTPDGTHGQDGLPRSLMAYPILLWILNYMGIPTSVMNNQIRMDAETYQSIHFTGNVGSGAIRGTEEQNYIAMDIGLYAYKQYKKFINNILSTL